MEELCLTARWIGHRSADFSLPEELQISGLSLRFSIFEPARQGEPCAPR
jgi:hypothetical protein